MSPFLQLGLPQDADEAMIRRAYAKLLKSNRPEDAPQAFQALNEAYRAAIAIARQRLCWPDDHTDTATAEQCTDEAPYGAFRQRTGPDADEEEAGLAEEAPVERFDFEGFLREVHRRCHEDSPEVVLRWLNACPDLYRIDLKTEVGAALFQHWMSAPHASNLRAGHAGTLSEFFHIDFFRICEAAESRQLILSQEELEAAIASENMTALAEPRTPIRHLRQLKQSFNPWRSLLIATIPERVPKLAMLARRLKRVAGGELPKGLDARQVDFFEKLASPGYFGPWKLKLWLMQVAFLLLSGTLVSLLFSIGLTEHASFIETWVPLISVTGAIVVLGLREGVRWVRLYEDQPVTRAGIVARWCPPVFCLLSVAISLTGAHWPASLLLLPAGAVVLRNLIAIIQSALFAMAGGIVFSTLLANRTSNHTLLVAAAAFGLTACWATTLLTSRHLSLPLRQAKSAWGALLPMGTIFLSFLLAAALE